MADMCRVKVADYEERQYPDGTSFLEISKDFQDKYDAPIVLVLKRKTDGNV